MKEIRYFVKQSSVFAKWEDSPSTVKACWEVDKKLMKLRKFIKSESDLASTFDMLELHYNRLKLQFRTMIGQSNSYPSVDFMAFGHYCDQWKIIESASDKTQYTLTHQDIDRIFIATNFEEEELDDNDDRNLCRYEFFEILVRIAKTKYMESS